MRAARALVLLCLLPLAAAAEPAARVYWLPQAPRQGDPLVVDVRPAAPASRVTGTFRGERLRFFPWGEGRWRALAPLPVDLEPGDHPLVLRITGPGGEAVEEVRPVTVSERWYPTSTLRVDPRFTRPPPEAMERIEAEHRKTTALYEASADERLWRAPFQRPRQSRKTAGYGTRRTFNGELMSRHLGLDLAGATGDPVTAAAAGRVVLAEPLYFSGNTVIVDHGLGLFTVYFHLHALAVEPGDLVTPGDRVGTVGATGRVTGPHLHFGVKLDGVYVHPETFLSLPWGGDPGPSAEGNAPAEPQAGPRPAKTPDPSPDGTAG